MAKNVAVGLLRPPHVFFYEVDVKKKVGERSKLKAAINDYLFGVCLGLSGVIILLGFLLHNPLLGILSVIFLVISLNILNRDGKQKIRKSLE